MAASAAMQQEGQINGDRRKGDPETGRPPVVFPAHGNILLRRMAITGQPRTRSIAATIRQPMTSPRHGIWTFRRGCIVAYRFPLGDVRCGSVPSPTWLTIHSVCASIISARRLIWLILLERSFAGGNAPSLSTATISEPRRLV